MIANEVYRYIPEVKPVDPENSGITWPRVKRKLFVPIINNLPQVVFSRGIFATDKSQNLIHGLLKGKDTTDLPWSMVARNIIGVRDKVFLLANRGEHSDMWFRDTMYAAEALKSPELEVELLRTFEEKQGPNGQMPTAAAIVGNTGWHWANDESTMLYLIWSARLNKATNGEFRPNPEVFTNALCFVQSHIDQGRYISPRGARRGWLDAFLYRSADVITQNQGLLAVSLMAAEKLGFFYQNHAIKKAVANYKALVNGKEYLPHSARYSGAPDASVLYPEYLAITLFGQEILTPGIVEATIKSVPKSRWGYKVLTENREGKYFAQYHFIGDYKQGEYQNGGVWLFWDSNLRLVGELYNLIKPDYRLQLKRYLDGSRYAESIWTGGKYEGKLTPRARQHIWNLAIDAQQQTVDQILRRRSMEPVLVSKEVPPGTKVR